MGPSQVGESKHKDSRNDGGCGWLFNQAAIAECSELGYNYPPRYWDLKVVFA